MLLEKLIWSNILGNLFWPTFIVIVEFQLPKLTCCFKVNHPNTLNWAMWVRLTNFGLIFKKFLLSFLLQHSHLPITVFNQLVNYVAHFLIILLFFSTCMISCVISLNFKFLLYFCIALQFQLHKWSFHLPWVLRNCIFCMNLNPLWCLTCRTFHVWLDAYSCKSWSEINCLFYRLSSILAARVAGRSIESWTSCQRSVRYDEFVCWRLYLLLIYFPPTPSD